MASEAPESLEGTLERVVFSNPENAWSVVRLKVRHAPELVTAVGNLMGVSPGESLRLSGTWVQDPKFGRQFAISSYLILKPSTLTGIEKYLGSGLIKGIGPELARRLVAQFGLETLEVIEHHPERLARVPGIGPKRRAEIHKAWAEQSHIKNLMVFLQAHGVSTGFAFRVHKTYGAQALEVVRRDPYRLARDIYGVGFATADRLGAALGLPRDAPERCRAGLLHLLTEATDRGHLFLPERELLSQGRELLGVGEELLPAAVAELVAEGAAAVETLPKGHRAAPDRAIYPTPLHAAETTVAERLAALARRGPVDPALDVERALVWFATRRGLELAPEQRDAIARGLSSRVLVVTGGPGTGKTTLVRGIVEILLKKQRRVLLAAPTGRATQRLSEATGIEARTVHRLLEYNPVTRGFDRGPERPLAADLLVLDEVSMLDVKLAAAVLQALPDHARLLLVGDVDQLPSVGPGRVLGDLIDSGAVDVVRLTHIFRQAQRSLIVTNAHRIQRGEMPELPGDAGGDADFFFIDRRTPEEASSTVGYLVSRRIPESFGLDPMKDIQVLTPMNRGLLGTRQLNEALKELLNPATTGRTEVVRGHRAFAVGDKVMQVRNNYDLGVWNGDVGRITAIDPEQETVAVTFDDRRVLHDFTSLDELVLAYACSIHKAQGSEYPCVVLPLSSQHWVMLQRNLLYTAVTRARRLAILVGEMRALAVAVRNQRHQERWSLLPERLQGRV